MIRGQRVELDLGDGDEGQNIPTSNIEPQGAFVGNVLERTPAAPKPPSAPTLKTKGGFPEHRKRNVESKFKQRNAAKQDSQFSNEDSAPHQEDAGESEDPNSVKGSSGKAKSWEEEEKDRIDAENRQKLAQMSAEEIEEERQELLSSLSPAVLQKLLQRSNIDSGSSEADLSHPSQTKLENAKPKKTTNKSVSFAEPTVKDLAASDQDVEFDVNNDDEEILPTEPLPHDTVHFPRPLQPPDLDPSSSTFLEDLHEKYFPSLPTDPEKLEWMQQPTSEQNTYNPSASTLSPKDLRFSFKGDLIPPTLAAQIPVTAGLHHHGDAPDSAGYTIPELAHLGHSSYPAQRCIAFQTLGRILYRLGRGEFGDSGEPGAGTVGAEDTFGELARGLWGVVEKEKVIEMLVRESEGKGVDGGRHLSAKAYATEAVWLWQRGGGRRWKAE